MAPTLIAALAAILGPLVTFLIVAKRFSGKIANSEAGDLWKESAAIRADLFKRNEYLTQKLEETGEQLRDLARQLDDLDDRIGELRAENTRLKAENTRLKKRVTELEALNGTHPRE